MPITVGHSKSITVADGTNTGIVRPSDWNSNHAVTLNISGTDIFGAFSNAGNVTFGTDTAGYITATAPAGGGGGGAAISAGTQSQNTGTIVFSNSNGLTFGLNAGTLTGSHNGYTGATTQFLTTAQPPGAYLTTARASNDAVGLNTALTAGPLAWTVNSSGLSLNAGSVAGTTTGFGGNLISGSMTNNTAGLNLSLNHPAWLTTAANSTHSHGNPTLNLTNLAGTTASASNGFTLSLSATAQSNQTMGLYGVSNTTGASSSSTFDARSVSFQGAGIASVGFSNGSVVVSVPSGGGAGDGYNSAQFTNSTANSTMPIVWAGNSGGSGNITMGLTGSTVTASAPSGGGGATLSKWAWPNLQFNTQTQQFLQSTFVVWPFMAEEVSFNWLRFAKSVSMASTSFASTANTTFSFNQAETHRLVMYSRGTGASSQSLQSVMSTSASIQFSLNVYFGSATNTSQGHSMGITYPMSTGTSSFSTEYNTSNLSTIAISTGNNTRLTGMKMFDIAWASSLTNGEYFMAYNVSTASTTQGTNLSGARLLMSNIGMSVPNNTIGLFGDPNNASIQWQSGLGSFTTVGGATTGSMGFSNISSSASHVMPHMTFLRI